MNARRRKLIRVSRLLAQDMLWSEGTVVHIKCTKGLPADAVFISLTYDHMRDVYFFCYQSADWEPIPDNQVLPELDLEFTNLYVGSFLERAAELINPLYDTDSARWIEEYQAFKKRVGWPE